MLPHQSRTVDSVKSGNKALPRKLSYGGVAAAAGRPGHKALQTCLDPSTTN